MTPDAYVSLPGRAILALSGEEARSFLQGLVTNDIDLVSPDRAIYAALLTPQGKFLHDFFVAELDGRLLLDCDGARIDDLLKRLKMYRLRARVEIADETADWQVVALLPPAGAALPEAGAARKSDGGVVFTDPRHAGLGYRAILPAGVDPAALGGTQTDVAAYERRRIALGIPGTHDLLPEKSLPLECGFDELHGVSFTKGCYVGQEVTARMKHRNLVKKRLVPIAVDGDVAPGTAILSGGSEAGQVLSGQDGHAIALLRLDYADRDGLVADGVAVHPQKPDWANF